MNKLVLFYFLFLLFGCSSDDIIKVESKLPEATQIGANTFGCLIDGKILLPRSGNNSLVYPLSGADLFGFGNPGAYDYFELEIRDYKSTFTTSFIFHMHDVYQNGIGTYNIDISNGMQDIDGLNNNYIHCTIYNSTKKNYQKYVSYNNSGTFTITRLTPSTGSGLIISGTFSCNLRNINDPLDEIKITNGRFDINSWTIASTYFP
ncbi:MAG: hypothetical protein ACOH1O_02515 [Flavobacterium sp.]